MIQERWKHHTGKTAAPELRGCELINRGGIEGTVHSAFFEERPGHRMIIKRWERRSEKPEIELKMCRRAAEHAATLYKHMKGDGLPVPTTYRLHEEKPEVLMTDLTRNGKYVLLTANNEPNLDLTPASIPVLSVTQMYEIAKQIAHIESEALRYGYHVHSDAYMILVPTDKSTDTSQISCVIADFGSSMEAEIGSQKAKDNLKRMGDMQITHLLVQISQKYSQLSEDEVRNVLESVNLKLPEKTIWD